MTLAGQINSVCSASDRRPVLGIAKNQRLLDETNFSVQKKSNGRSFIGDVLDKAFEQVQALVVLFFPDDEVKLKDQFLKKSEVLSEGRYKGQARPNVIFEAGVAMGRHPVKTIMVQVGDIKSFSDIAGRHMVHLDDTYASRNDFALRLSRLCKVVDTTGTQWPKVGTFIPTASVATPTRSVVRPKRKR